MEKRYVVPEAGLDAAQQALRDKFAFVERNDSSLREYLKTSLEAFICWQSENPQVPTTPEASELISAWCNETSCGKTEYLVTEWQRRMYLAPEPEVPEGLVGIADKLVSNPAWRKADLDHALLSAFRLGKKAGGNGR